MDLLQTILGFLLALFILVSVHEFGHFYVARLCGVKVLRFCVGIGKPFCSFRDKKGTEFGLAPFPLGGYVKMLDEREVEVPEDQKHLSYNSKTVWQRIAILSAGPLANFILAFVVFWAVFGFGGSVGVAPIIGTVEPESLAESAGLERGQEIVAIDGVATPTQQMVMERLIRRLGESGSLEVTVRDSGSDLRYDTNIDLDQWLRGVMDPHPFEGLGLHFYFPDMYIAEVVAGGSAEQAGLQSGDRLQSVDGQGIKSLRWWVDYVRARPNQQVELEVIRDGQPLFVDLAPQQVALEDGSQAGQVGVHVAYDAWPQDMLRRESFGLFSSLAQAGGKTADMTQFVLMSLKKLIVGEISTNNLSGPIGIAKVAGDHAKAGIIYYVEFLAILSIYLGVLNLLPIPILDGGHILYCLVEAVKGSPISERVQMMGYSAGLALLACVMVVAFYNDILRL